MHSSNDCNGTAVTGFQVKCLRASDGNDGKQKESGQGHHQIRGCGETVSRLLNTKFYLESDREACHMSPAKALHCILAKISPSKTSCTSYPRYVKIQHSASRLRDVELTLHWIRMTCRHSVQEICIRSWNCVCAVMNLYEIDRWAFIRSRPEARALKSPAPPSNQAFSVDELMTNSFELATSLSPR
jgi:hypothetical protein